MTTADNQVPSLAAIDYKVDRILRLLETSPVLFPGHPGNPPAPVAPPQARSGPTR